MVYRVLALFQIAYNDEAFNQKYELTLRVRVRVRVDKITQTHLRTTFSSAHLFTF